MVGNHPTADHAYNFETQKQQGEPHEQTVLQAVGEALSTPVRHFEYESHPYEQLSGVDGITHSGVKVDVKVQRKSHIETGNLPVEIWSDIAGQTPGWFYTGNASLIAWAYCDFSTDELLQTGYMLHKTERFVDWFHRHKQRFRRVDIDNDGYTAVVSLVPLITIPDNFLEHIEINETTSDG